ncbi:MAG: galactosyldiacylglycerol synthase [Acidobacteria bacterium]|nr:MAG: galactosyldiacylglycerol synthase [Acidobacteriota bacterium]
MIQLLDAETNKPIGTITEGQLQFLIDELEEESATDQDYYIDAVTIDMLQQDGGDANLIALLRNALGAREGFEVRWTKS